MASRVKADSLEELKQLVRRVNQAQSAFTDVERDSLRLYVESETEKQWAEDEDDARAAPELARRVAETLRVREDVLNELQSSRHQGVYDLFRAEHDRLEKELEALKQGSR